LARKLSWNSAERPQLFQPRIALHERPRFPRRSGFRPDQYAARRSVQRERHAQRLQQFPDDGLDNNSYGTSNQNYSSQVVQPSPDALAEFRVITSNFSAEYGE